MTNELIFKAVDELKPYENNPRINDGAVDMVASSIAEFGFKVPIVIDSNNVIVAGHTRWKASKKLGLETVPCIIADDLSEEQIKAFRLADNKTSEFSVWDFEALDKELAELVEFDMSDFGFLADSFIEFEDQLEKYGGDTMDVKNSVSDSFTITLIINNDYEELVNDYIKEYKREGLVEILIQALEEKKDA